MVWCKGTGVLPVAKTNAIARGSATKVHHETGDEEADDEDDWKSARLGCLRLLFIIPKPNSDSPNHRTPKRFWLGEPDKFITHDSDAEGSKECDVTSVSSS